MGIHEPNFRCGNRFRRGRPLQPGNSDSDPRHPSLRVWRLRIPGVRTGAAVICLAPGLEHLGIRDPRRSQERRICVTHCKHGAIGVGDKFCTPIEGEMKMRGLGRGGKAANACL
jgi:hypothetical protein